MRHGIMKTLTIGFLYFVSVLIEGKALFVPRAVVLKVCGNVNEWRRI